MSDVVIVHIPESKVDGQRLGRHVEHDPKSREYPWGAVIAATDLRTVHHRRFGGIFDQGDLGSCTGNAAAGAVNTSPLRKPGGSTLTESDAVKIYSLATQLDGFQGEYPPDDTGSSGLAAAQALKQMGYISEYRHAFTLAEALSALQIKPVITGVNWYEGFDKPDHNGVVKINGQVRGGHEFEVVGFEWVQSMLDSLIVADNSWGAIWGLHGQFTFTVRTWRQLLSEQGDVTILGKA